LALVLVAALVGVLLTRHSASAARSGPVAKYGGIPKWLPKAAVPVDRIVKASRAHSVLAIQGNTVSVHLAHGHVLATAVGPSVPEDGRFPVPSTSPCTFVVTFAASTGEIPLNATAFKLIDGFDHVRHPRVTTIGGGPPPRRVLPGRTVSLRVHDVLPTGDGGLTWAPDGGRPIVSWDFDVEID
jgi:hypothetical protein